MCPSGKCFGRRSRGENFCGGGRARRGRCQLVCAAKDRWQEPGRSRDSILPFMVEGTGRKVWGVEILLTSAPWRGGKVDLFCVIELLCLNLASHLERARMAIAPGRAQYSIGKLGTIILCALLPPLLMRPRLLGLPNQGVHGAGPQAAVPLDGSETRKFQLGPGEHKNFLYAAEAQSAVSISFVQTEAMLSVAWSSDGELQLPRTNDDHSISRLLVEEPVASTRSIIVIESWQLTVSRDACSLSQES
jgi:hypothetical protein